MNTDDKLAECRFRNDSGEMAVSIYCSRDDNGTPKGIEIRSSVTNHGFSHEVRTHVPSLENLRDLINSLIEAGLKYGVITGTTPLMNEVDGDACVTL